MLEPAVSRRRIWESAIACSGPAIPISFYVVRWRNPGPFISIPPRDAPPGLTSGRLLASPAPRRARFAGATNERIGHKQCGVMV